MTNGVDTYVIRATDANGNVKYYTGRAGDGWLSENIADAFGYQSLDGARSKATNMNRMMDIHDQRFSVPWIREFVEQSGAR